MKLRMHYPRVLLVLVLLIGALASTVVLLADDPEAIPTEFVPIATVPTPAPLTKADKEDAINIVKKSGVVESINGGQNWDPVRIYRTKVTGMEGASVEAVWQDPVESSGPWSVLHCSGTIKAYMTTPWSQIIRLLVWVNMEERSVAGLGVTSQPEDNPQAFETLGLDEPVKVYDTKTGEILYEGTLSSSPTESEICEKGTYYVD